MPKALLTNFIVAAPLTFGVNGEPVRPGDSVRAYLDQTVSLALPDFIDMVVQAPITRQLKVIECQTVEVFNYTFEYELNDLLGAVEELKICYFTGLEAVSCCQVLDTTKANRDDVVRTTPLVDSLTGASGLDKVITRDEKFGRVQKVVVGQLTYEYVLLAGTDAENDPFVIRPDDYAAVSNEKVWKMLSDVIPGPYLLDSDAATAGVLVGQRYYIPTNGVVRVRLA